MDYNELYHHGVKGQKWGVIRSREQLGYKITNKKRFNISDNEQLGKNKLLRKLLFKKSEPLTNNRKETKEEYEAKKEKALKSGTATEILKFKGDLTNQQMQNAINRINLEKQLSDISSREIKSGADKFNSVMNRVDKVNTGLEKGIRAYNTGAKIYNSLNKNGQKLPTINGENQKDKNPVIKRLIKKGTPKEISEHFGEFTPEELKTINQRFVNEEAIRKRIG